MDVKLSQQGRFYDNYWADMKPFGGYKLQRVIKLLTLLRNIGPKRNEMELLDLGCGDGRMVAIWESVVKRATGMDLSHKAMLKARERYPEINFYTGNGCNTDFIDNQFDIIISQEVIEHIEDQNAYLSEAYRILKPKGILLLTTPNKFYFERVKGGNYSNQPIENIMNINELKNLIKNKFSINKIETIIASKGDFGIYRIIDSNVIAKLTAKLIGKSLHLKLKEKLRLGLHIVLFAQKS